MYVLTGLNCEVMGWVFVASTSLPSGFRATDFTLKLNCDPVTLRVPDFNQSIFIGARGQNTSLYDHLFILFLSL
jgi:hypothetical protein